MSRENVEVVRLIQEAWNRGDYATALESVHPEIEVQVAGGFTTDGTYRGLEGLGTFLQEFWGDFEDRHTDFDQFITSGDDVLYAGHHYGRGGLSAVEVEMHDWQVATVREGKIVRWRLFRIKREAFEAVGLQE
jgi:ketosteroid isomerase-like protein